MTPSGQPRKRVADRDWAEECFNEVHDRIDEVQEAFIIIKKTILALASQVHEMEKRQVLEAFEQEPRAPAPFNYVERPAAAAPNPPASSIKPENESRPGPG